ncbi:MAG: hypothetical protein H6739_34475 [Alphaproteobacteria bacterium]|nr:hypothetical protein [Alphaproteobacteria bacterium]
MHLRAGCPIPPDFLLDLLRYDPLTAAAIVLPLAICAAGFGLVGFAAWRLRRPPNLPGWLLGPTAGLVAAAGVLGVSTPQAVTFIQAAEGRPTLQLFGAMLTLQLHGMLLLPVLVLSGSVLLGAAFVSARRGSGRAAVLGLCGGLLLGLAGARWAHQEMVFAWLQAIDLSVLYWGDAADAWQLKVWLLRYVALLAAILGLVLWQRRGDREGFRAAMMVGVAVVALGVAVATMDRLHAMAGPLATGLSLSERPVHPDLLPQHFPEADRR